MPEFDFRAACKELAEAQLLCGYHVFEDGMEITCFGGFLSINGQGHLPHKACGSVGLIAPFAELRVECPCLALIQYGSDGINHWYAMDGCRHCYLRAGRTSEPHNNCSNCEGQGWMPEPDAENAAVRVLRYFAMRSKENIAHLQDWDRIMEVLSYEKDDFEAAVFRAAKAWLKEQHDIPRSDTGLAELAG